jgi:hypothetical protein
LCTSSLGSLTGLSRGLLCICISSSISYRDICRELRAHPANLGLFHLEIPNFITPSRPFLQKSHVCKTSGTCKEGLSIYSPYPCLCRHSVMHNQQTWGQPG